MTDSTLHVQTGWTVALAAALSIVGVAVLPPFVAEAVREPIMHAFAGVCHQLPGRSAHVGGVPLAVCDRCLGIYSGVVLGIMALPVIPRAAEYMHRRAGLVLVAALVPLALDWVGPVFDAWPNMPWSRAATGLLLGGAAGVLVGRAAAHVNQPVPAVTPSEGASE